MKFAHKMDNRPGGECSYCGMDLGDAETLAEHKKLHLNRPDFQCIQCELVVTRKQSLKQHMRIHVRAIPQI